jgi:histidine kinase/DNA gyrase B/HSP90-like ATPase
MRSTSLWPQLWQPVTRCRRWLSADPPNLERAKITLERIIRDANSASEVVGRIRALFSQIDKTRSEVDITEVITEVCRLMADELAIKNIQVETDFDRSLPQVLIDPIQMEQVLINLIRNAIDALETIVDGARLIRLRTVRDGDNTIRVEVRDVGPGMKDDARMRESLSDLLEFLGWRAVALGSASEYMSYSRPDLPACLIPDVELPDINGLDFQKQISHGDHPPSFSLPGMATFPRPCAQSRTARSIS